jgi:Family of unknown function (DUF6488)
VKIWSKKVFANRFVGLSMLAVCSAGGLSMPVLASGDSECHFHGKKAAEESTVVMCSEKHKERLVKKGTIASSWSGIKHSSVEQVDGKKGKEWKLTYNDPAATDKSKSTLYMFFAQNGNFLASNFTGK